MLYVCMYVCMHFKTEKNIKTMIEQNISSRYIVILMQAFLFIFIKLNLFHLQAN
jgi:hypothetical protein